MTAPVSMTAQIAPLDNNRFGVAMLQRKLARMPDAVICFDLDGVLLDASHRHKFLPCGALDLEQYRRDTTAESVALDKPLPMLELVHWLNSVNRPYYVATARVACEHTRARLAAAQIRPLGIGARLGHTDRRPDPILKADYFESAFTLAERQRMILLDDIAANCQAAISCGMSAHQIVTEAGSLLIR